MSDPKGDHLYVNLSASKARRRLKRFGHGVRKIHSAGKNQAVIIHTATGRHLEELEAQFADVGSSRTKYGLSVPIENLKNLGPASAQWLREAGIRTRAELERLGPVVAYLSVRQRQPRASLNLLWSLAAALVDHNWQDLDPDTKRKLQAELRDRTHSLE